jgi:hypothetical protein
MIFGSPPIVTNGLVLHLDAANMKSYPRSGNTWFDMSGNSNNGTLTNGPTYTSANGGAIVFDGVNDYATFGNTPLGYTSDVTVSVWFMLITYANIYNYIASKYGGGTGWILNGTNNVLRVDGRAGGAYRIVESTVPINLNQWYYFTFTKQNTIWSIYANGVFSTSQNFVGDGSIFSSNNLTISDSYGPSSINGRVSTTQIYNRALSSQEVLQNYNALKSRFV